MEKYRIAILNGVARSGKDSFIDYFREAAKNDTGAKSIVESFSVIDPIKEIMTRKHGWTGTKTDKDRALMHKLKIQTDKESDYSFRVVTGRVVEALKALSGPDVIGFIFIVAREPEDIARYKDHYGKNAITVIIRHPAAESDIPDNPADRGVFDFNYDHEIKNTSSQEVLQLLAKNFYNLIKKTLDLNKLI